MNTRRAPVYGATTSGTVPRVQTYRRRLGIREWLLAPALTLIEEMFSAMSLDVSQLQAAVTRNGSTIAQVVVLVADQRNRIAALNARLETAQDSEITPETREQLRAMLASLDASTDAAASVLADPVADPAIPTGEVPQPPASNPGTPDPMSVPGAVEATAPLPSQLDPQGHTSQTDGGPSTVEQAADSAEAQAPDVVATPEQVENDDR